MKKQQTPLILLDQLELRKEFLNAIHNFSLSKLENSVKHFENVYKKFQVLKFRLKGLPGFKTLEGWEICLKSFIHFLKWGHAISNALDHADIELKAAKTQASILNKFFEDSNNKLRPSEERLLTLARLFSQVTEISAIEKLLDVLKNVVFPIYFSESYDNLDHLAFKRRNKTSLEQDQDDKGPFLIKLLLFLDKEPWANPQVIQTNLIYNILAKIKISRWPSGFRRFELRPVSTLDSSLYKISEFVIQKERENETEVNLVGQITFWVPQSILGEPIEIKLFGNFISDNGSIKPAEVIGYYQLKVKIIDRDNFAFKCGYKALDRRIFDILQQIDKELPGLDPNEKKDFLILLSAFVNYQGSSMQQGLFKGISDIKEAEFKDKVIQHLRANPQIGEDLIEEPTEAGGRIEISFRGIPAELKVEKKIKSREKITEKYRKQPVCYASCHGRQLGILCVLDLVEKTNPPADIRNNILVVTPEVHGFENNVISYPSKIVVVIIDGNTISPSNYS